MGRFVASERFNELVYLEKRATLCLASDEERQFPRVFEAIFKWGAAVERSVGGELGVVAMVPIPRAATGRSNAVKGAR